MKLDLGCGGKMNDKQKKILTIAVPTYNGSKTINSMLDILLPQVDDRIEILISDNCSTDNTEEIVSNYILKYEQIRYIKNEKNLGADGNFLQCMLRANGKFTMLISDDDIIIENTVNNIVDFLEKNPELQLAYLDTVGFKNIYTGLEDCHRYKKFTKEPLESFVTKDKREFMKYAQRMWGFTSTYIWRTERMQEVINPEKYFGSYFLQCYMHIEASNKSDDLLGVIKGPCIAVGEYGIIGNYDTAQVEGISYRKMIDKAVKSGYDKNQLDKYYKWKLQHLVIRAIIKEKVANVKKTKYESIIEATKGLFLCRVKLMAAYLLPRKICVLVLNIYRKSKGVSSYTYVNRPTD